MPGVGAANGIGKVQLPRGFGWLPAVLLGDFHLDGLGKLHQPLGHGVAFQQRLRHIHGVLLLVLRHIQPGFPMLRQLMNRAEDIQSAVHLSHKGVVGAAGRRPGDAAQVIGKLRDGGDVPAGDGGVIVPEKFPAVLRGEIQEAFCLVRRIQGDGLNVTLEIFQCSGEGEGTVLGNGIIHRQVLAHHPARALLRSILDIGPADICNQVGAKHGHLITLMK